MTARLAALARISPEAPIDLDALLARFDRRAGPPGQDIAPCPLPVRLPATPLAKADAIAIGVDLKRPPADPAALAFQLCALAAEQDVEVVVLCEADYSGLERFGLRTERVAGSTEAERAACRDQLCQFWGIELVLPVPDLPVPDQPVPDQPLPDLPERDG
jgi:hypothetical protein